jgi:lipoic acid synthetase
MDERARKPAWLKVKAPGGPEYLRLKALMREQQLHTVCEEAHCPNMGECWEAGTATFMILGDVCTRACGFCAVTSGRPDAPPDRGEARRVAYTVAQLGLTHAVVTSVNRDDQPDGGAAIFADTIRWIRRLSPGTSVEVLIPDFVGNWDALDTVLAAEPDILNHNTETVPRLYPRVRFKARYERTLELLERAAMHTPRPVTKTGIMLGLGETIDEVREVMRDLRAVEVDVLTIGQYLRPTLKHLPVVRYVPPKEFDALREEGLSLGFKHVESGPLVRSSYHAERQIPAGARGGRAEPLPLVLH